MTVGARPRVQPGPCGHSQGPLVHGYGRGSVAKTLGARSGAVGVWPRPCGPGQELQGGGQERGCAARCRDGAVIAVWVLSGAVGARPRAMEV